MSRNEQLLIDALGFYICVDFALYILFRKSGNRKCVELPEL